MWWSGRVRVRTGPARIGERLDVEVLIDSERATSVRAVDVCLVLELRDPDLLVVPLLVERFMPFEGTLGEGRSRLDVRFVLPATLPPAQLNRARAITDQP